MWGSCGLRISHPAWCLYSFPTCLHKCHSRIQLRLEINSLNSRSLKKNGPLTVEECLFLLPSRTPFKRWHVLWVPRWSPPGLCWWEHRQAPLVLCQRQWSYHIRGSEILSFWAYIDTELCLGPETRSPVWWQTSLSIFFCLVHLHRFKRVDGGLGERWWELWLFNSSPKS